MGNVLSEERFKQLASSAIAALNRVKGMGIRLSGVSKNMHDDWTVEVFDERIYDAAKSVVATLPVRWLDKLARVRVSFPDAVWIEHNGSRHSLLLAFVRHWIPSLRDKQTPEALFRPYGSLSDPAVPGSAEVTVSLADACEGVDASATTVMTARVARGIYVACNRARSRLDALLFAAATMLANKNKPGNP